jgi:hypothetical protein
MATTYQWKPSYPEDQLTCSDLTGLDRSQVEQGAQVLLLLEHVSLFRNILESPYNVSEVLLIGPPFYISYRSSLKSDLPKRHSLTKTRQSLQTLTVFKYGGETVTSIFFNCVLLRNR